MYAIRSYYAKLRVLFFGIVLLLFTFFLSFIAYPLPLKLLIFLFIIQGFVKSSLQQVFAMFQGYKLFKLQVLIEVFVYIGLVICALIVWQAKMSIVNLGVLMLIVITSYSIHYTKLYDESLYYQ